MQTNSACRFLTHPITVLSLSAFMVLIVIRAEHTQLTAPFVLSIWAFLASVIFLMSRRFAFSVYTSGLIIGTLTVISFFKFRLKGFSLHAYDIAMSLPDIKAQEFLISSYTAVASMVILAIIIAIMISIFSYYVDKKRSVPIRSRTFVAAISMLAMPLTFPAEANAEDRYFYYMQGRHVSAFFVSLLDVMKIFSKDVLRARIEDMPSAQPFADTVDCGAGGKPDIYAILEESQTDPINFPQIAMGEAISRAMEGDHGQLRPLQVETFGGGTWITAFSFMTGLSSTDFGWRSPYLTVSMQDRIKGALPEVLARCGYRTIAILPLNYTFVNEGPFLTSIGFETVLDMAAIRAPSYHLRDSFYFDAAETVIAEHRKVDKRPLFLFIETMFPHSPYGERMEDSVSVPGEPFSNDPSLNEYLRRLIVARSDFAAFADRRKREQASNPSVVMSFGDHQSIASLPIVRELDGADVLSRPGSLAYRTFYSLAGDAPLPADREPLDVAFLGTRLLEAAGIPGSPLFEDLDRLRVLCRGAFHACLHREEIDRHLKRRVEGGYLALGDRAS